jgi:hypothetical protein
MGIHIRRPSAAATVNAPKTRRSRLVIRDLDRAFTSPLEMSCSVALDQYWMGWRLPLAH